LQWRRVLQFVTDLPDYACIGWELWPLHTIQVIRDRARTPARLRNPHDTNSHSSLLIRTAQEDDLFYLLTETRDFYATDPRDKIYAFLGMARGFFAHMIVADYSVSIHDVSVLIAQAAITRSGSLDITSLKKPPTPYDLVVANEKLPSWAPGFSSVKAPELPAAANFGISPFDPSRHAIFATQSNCTKTLLVEGVLLGQIQSTSGLSPSVRHDDSGGTEVKWIPQVPWGRGWPDWDEIIFLIHVRLHQKNRWVCHPAEVSYVDIAHRVVWMDWANLLEPEPEPQLDSEARARSLALQHANRCWSSRQYFMSWKMVHTDTNYIGFIEGGAPVKLGDVIVLFQNTKTLKVLRRMPVSGSDDEEQFEVVSDVYVHQPDQHEYERNNHSWRRFVLV
jgi:hypothetical protein